MSSEKKAAKRTDAPQKSQPEYTIQIEGVNNEKCLFLPISLNVPYHTNGQFSAILKYIEDEDLTVDLLITDGELRALSYQMDARLTEEEAKIKANEDGQNWVKLNLETNNKARYERLVKSGKLNVFHYDGFTSEHKEALGQIENTIIDPASEDNTSPLYKALNAASTNFTAQFFDKNQNDPGFNLANPDKERALQLSKKYIKKECGFMHFCHTEGLYTQMAYPIEANDTNRKVFNCVTSLGGIKKKNASTSDSSGMLLLNLDIKSSSQLSKKKEKKTSETESSNPPKPTYSSSPSPIKSFQNFKYSDPSHSDDSSNDGNMPDLSGSGSNEIEFNAFVLRMLFNSCLTPQEKALAALAVMSGGAPKSPTNPSSTHPIKYVASQTFLPPPKDSSAERLAQPKPSQENWSPKLTPTIRPGEF